MTINVHDCTCTYISVTIEHISISRLSMFILPLGFYVWIRGTEVLELGVSSEFCLSLQGIDSGVQA